MQLNIKTKRTQAAIVLVIAAVLVLSGAFAWYTFSQNRINTFDISSYPGVNLHDDFEGGPDKDVYVENSGNFNVFVRIKLAEYLQTETQGSLIDGHNRDDKDYWFPHNGIGGADNCEIKDPYNRGNQWRGESFHDYFTWTMGGQKYYKTAVAQLGDGAFADDPEVCSDLTGYTAIDSENGIEQTLWADVITMAQWLAGGYTYFDGENPVEVAAGENAFGNFWIVDTDGWCYWAQPLEPQQATGLLLNSVEQTAKLFDSDANYFIDVWLQAVDEVDVGMFERAENGGVTDGARILTQLMFNDVMIAGADGYYRNISDNVYIQLTDKNGATVKDAKAFVPIGSGVEQLDGKGKVNAPDRLYIGETYKITHLLWNGEDYTNFNDFDSNAPYYNIGETENESFTLIGGETGEDGLTYLTIKDSDGNTLYLSSTRPKADALITPFSEDESEGEDEGTPPEPEPVPHDPPQFEKYEQGYPGTGPFAVMYAGEDGKIGSVDDTRYDVANYEARYFYHIGSGVYVEVASADTVVTIPDGTGNLDITGTKDYPETIYYFSSITHGDRYVINNLNGKTVEENVGAAFAETLQIGEPFGYYDAPNTGYSTIYKGDEMVEHQQPGSPNKISRTFTMKPIYRHTDGNLYIQTDFYKGDYGQDYEDLIGYFIKGMGANGEFGGQFFGVMVQRDGDDLVAPTIQAPQGGGTEVNPFQIESRAQMDWVTSQVADGRTFENEYLKIADNVENGILDMGVFAGGTDESADTSFTPIGTDTAQFKGTFDGNGKTIRNLKVSGSYNYRGLFGYIGAGGTVKNVKLEGADVSGGAYVGGIAGYNNDGTIDNCQVLSGAVSGTGSDGGVVGYNNGTVQSCENNSAVTGGTGQYTGGIAGFNDSVITNCKNTQAITGSGNYNVAGIAGHNGYAGVITNCDNEGEVSSPANWVGGITGSNRGSIQNSHNKSSVSGSKDNVGGISGQNDGAVSSITGCSNTGTVSGAASVGGVVGNSNGAVTESYNTASVTGSGNNVGGVTGYNAGTVQESYSTGTVTGYSVVGGVAGQNNSTVKQCYSTGDVISTYNYSYIGGVVGRNAGTTSNCYSLSNVTGHYYVGGVIGSNGGNSHGGTLETSYHAKGVITAHSQKGGIAGTMDDNFMSGRVNTLNYIRNCVALTPQIINKDGSSSQTGKAIGFIALFSDVATYYPNNYGYSGMAITIGTSPGYEGIPVGTQTPDWSFWVNKAQFSADVWTMDSAEGSLPVFRWANPGLEPPEILEDGSEAAPFLITQQSDLSKLNNAPAGTFYKLSNDFSLSGFSASITNFAGTLDGGGHTLSGLTLTGAIDDRGLFATIAATGVVKNLKLSDVNITGRTRVGAFAGTNHGTISNCHVLSGIGKNIDGTDGTIGGIAGNNASAGKIEKCSNVVSVTGTGTVIGGVAGNNNGSITNCYAWGNVTGDNTAGGVIGTNSGSVSNVYHAGGTVKITVGGNPASNSMVGGIAAFTYGNLTYSVALANSIGAPAGSGSVGNIVGSDLLGYAKNCSDYVGKAKPAESVWRNLGFSDNVWVLSGTNLPTLKDMAP